MLTAELYRVLVWISSPVPGDIRKRDTGGFASIPFFVECSFWSVSLTISRQGDLCFRQPAIFAAHNACSQFLLVKTDQNSSKPTGFWLRFICFAS